MILPNDKRTILAKNAVPCAGIDGTSFPPLNCQIQASKLTCLVGPHRAQLRAYLLMLAGISLPEKGMVGILGQTVSDTDRLAWRNLHTRIGYVSGTSPLLSAQNGLMNVMLPVLYHENLTFSDAADKARDLLIELGCNFECTMFPAMLNNFQRIQLALARALILNPSILILDVPFNDLGAKEREQMGELLGKYQQQRIVCMIGGLQYPHFLEQYAHQIIFISEQKIIDFNGWQPFLQTEDQNVQALLSIL